MSIPDKEYKSRMVKVQNILEEKKIDLALVYFDEYNNMNGRYLTGWTPFFDKSAVIIPKGKDPILIGGPESEDFAKDAYIKNYRNVDAFKIPEIEYPSSKIITFKELFSEFIEVSKIKKVGIVGGSVITQLIYSEMMKSLNNTTEVIDITTEFERLRAIKSDWEIEISKKAYTIADEAFLTFKDTLVEGNTELMAAGAAEGRARALGADGFGYSTIVGSGKERAGMYVVRANERKLVSGESVMNGMSPRYNGYTSAIGCSLAVDGIYDELQKRYFSVALEGLFHTRDNLRVGMNGKEINSIPRNFFIRKGYENNITSTFVHSNGLSEYEIPYFGPNNKTDTLENGMIICLDIGLFKLEKHGGVRIETAYNVKNGKLIPMSERAEGIFSSVIK
ncbi:MAG: Xaa-Pro peptidase family protein [Actinobacteria bacterium]|nr:Xaa-Pro peptidase family protein [Actinomycetota bacterium]